MVSRLFNIFQISLIILYANNMRVTLAIKLGNVLFYSIY